MIGGEDDLRWDEWMVCSLTPHCIVGSSLVGLPVMICWLVGWLSGWLSGWLGGWLIGCLVGWLSG